MWVIKYLHNGMYYNPQNFWSCKQSNAGRFKSKEEAKKICENLSTKYDKCRIVKLKTCKEKNFVKPKINTVFLDTDFYPYIIKSINDSFKCEKKDSQIYVIDLVSMREFLWGSFEDYWQSLKTSEIKILWEP